MEKKPLEVFAMMKPIPLQATVDFPRNPQESAFSDGYKEVTKGRKPSNYIKTSPSWYKAGKSAARWRERAIHRVHDLIAAVKQAGECREGSPFVYTTRNGTETVRVTIEVIE